MCSRECLPLNTTRKSQLKETKVVTIIEKPSDDENENKGIIIAVTRIRQFLGREGPPP